MPAAKSLIPSCVNPDLQKEREAASFSVEEFQTWWVGGVDKLKEKREVEAYLLSDLEDGHKHEYLSHEDLYDLTIKQMTDSARKLRTLQKQKNPGGNNFWPTFMYDIITHGLMPATDPIAAHVTMFADVIRNQGTAEQAETFGKLAEDCKLIGTYAQTELGHGTYLRGLETRADYDASTQEFVLNTPRLTSYKWWPGGLGHTANYAMVVAQLYIEGASKGIQMFLVPIRHPETHMPLPGIDVGEVGKKVGMQGTNQGFLGLKNVRVPRMNMLMKNAKVHPDGSFVKSPASKLSYLTMVYTRCLLVYQNKMFLGEAATIATRYSAVRRQSPINPNQPEPQIMDHVTQQLKLFPEIATTIAFHISLQKLWEMYDQTLQEINDGVYTGLPELHALSCVLKVLCTSDSAVGIERLRLACGGHGYLSSSNLGNIYADAVAACTYEGENTVLLLQVGRFLVKSWSNLNNGEKLSPGVAYFEQANSIGTFSQWNGSWECIVKALQYVAANKTRIAFEHLSKRVLEGQTQQEAANNTGIELIQAAEFHGRQFVAASFLEHITGPKSAERSKAFNSVMQNILELYLVHTLLRYIGDILRFVKLTEAEVSDLQQRLKLGLKKIRPDAVAICDGLDFHDRVLNSVLGCYDGNVYERIFEAAKRSPLNQKPVPKSFAKYLKPFMKSSL